jgi:hypothetical protein
MRTICWYDTSKVYVRVVCGESVADSMETEPIRPIALD